jgi:hypothetical protein
MRRKWSYKFFWVFAVCGLFALSGLAGVSDAAGKGKGKGKKHGEEEGWMPPGLSKEEKGKWSDGRPPGWSKGKKTGWEGRDYPPGFDKWDKGEQEKWQEDLAAAEKEAGDRIRDRDRKRKKSKQRMDADAESVCLSVRHTARAGIPIDQTAALVKKGIEKGMTSEDIERMTRAVAYATTHGTAAEETVRYTEKVMDGTVRGEDIALDVYRWAGQKLDEKLKGGKR